MPGPGNSHYKDVSPLGTIPNTLSPSSSDRNHLSLSSLCRVGRRSWSLPNKSGLYLTTALNNPEEKQHHSRRCPSVRDSHKYLFKEWKIQIHQSQINGFPNKSSTDRRRVFWLPICSSHSALRQWCRGFLRISSPL